MNAFIGRRDDILELERCYDSGKFEMPVVYGRRRIGKTRLITEFIRGKRAVYMQARKSNARANLELMSRAIASLAIGAPLGSYASFEEAFDALGQLAREERLVFVIDEFPYLAEAYPAISSLLQDKIDHLYKPDTKLMLILCGSSLSFMEDQVLGYESPLYGRRTAQIRLEPLEFAEALECWPNMANEEAALCYGFTGGIPAYMEMVDPEESARENIERLFLNPRGYLFEEPTNLLLQECRSPEQYDAIVQAIASGRSRLNEIATATGIAESNTRTYLKKLISIGIVNREQPFGEDGNRRAVYCLADSMFGFWYRFVPGNIALVQNGLSDTAMERVEPFLPDYMGPVFELLCRQYLYFLARGGDLSCVPARLGRWWGNDPRTRSQEEIDLVVDDGGRNALFAECKWRNEDTGADVLKKLVFRSELFSYERKGYFVFSKSGFTSGCKELAKDRGDATLVDFGEMCARMRHPER